MRKEYKAIYFTRDGDIAEDIEAPVIEDVNLELHDAYAVCIFSFYIEEVTKNGNSIVLTSDPEKETPMYYLEGVVLTYDDFVKQYPDEKEVQARLQYFVDVGRPCDIVVVPGDKKGDEMFFTFKEEDVLLRNEDIQNRKNTTVEAL